MSRSAGAREDLSTIVIAIWLPDVLINRVFLRSTVARDGTRVVIEDGFLISLILIVNGESRNGASSPALIPGRGRRVAFLSRAAEPLIASKVELELGFGGQIQEIAAEAKFAPKVVDRAPDILTILTLIAAGVGCAFVPVSFRRVAMPGIVYRDDLAGPDRNALLAAARRRDDTAPAVKAFMRVLRAKLEQHDWVSNR